MDVKRGIAAGAIGTAVLTALWLIEPSIGLPKIAVGQILSSFMSVSVANFHVGAAGGWLMHFVVGILLALVYAGFFALRLPGPVVWRGALFGLVVFLVAQILFMPLVGAGFFSRGDPQLLIGSLLGHIAYGMVVAFIYAGPGSTAASNSPGSAQLS
jgi:uncharacterized membrane protein YagU involved in acid resistance